MLLALVPFVSLVEHIKILIYYKKIHEDDAFNFLRCTVHKFTGLKKHELTFVQSLESFRTDERLADLCYFLSLKIQHFWS